MNPLFESNKYFLHIAYDNNIYAVSNEISSPPCQCYINLFLKSSYLHVKEAILFCEKYRIKNIKVINKNNETTLIPYNIFFKKYIN